MSVRDQLVRLYAIHVRGGGTDIACAEHLREARRERTAQGVLVSTAPIDAPGESCTYCGATQGEAHQ